MGVILSLPSSSSYSSAQEALAGALQTASISIVNILFDVVFDVVKSRDARQLYREKGTYAVSTAIIFNCRIKKKKLKKGCELQVRHSSSLCQYFFPSQ